MATTRPSTPALPHDLGTVRQHAEGQFSYLGARYLRRLIEERRVPFYKIGGKVLLSAADVAGYVAAGRIEPGRSFVQLDRPA